MSQRKIAVRAVLRTDVGLVRTENQDFGVLTTAEEERASGAGQLLIVADGMGGHRGGATASRLAGETVKAQYLAAGAADPAVALREALLRANAKIFTESLSNMELRGMGTTTSALAVRDGQGWFAHVGDSRIYLIRNGEIKQLTDDHSLVASMVREGLLTAKEAETHPRRNVLQRSMGVAEDVDIDVRGPIDLAEGDTFVLCSDGLHGLVKEDEIRELARLSIERAADEYLRLALERGAPDNVTLIVARVESGDSRDADPGDSEKTVAIDRAAFEETLRDVPVPRIAEAVAAASQPAATPEPSAPVAAAEESPAPAPVPTAETPDPAPAAAPSSAGRMLLWILVLVIAAAAAGYWWYSSAQPFPAGTPKHTTTTR